MGEFFASLQATMGASLPGIIGALVILTVGWFLAILVRTLLKTFFELIHLNNIGGKNGKGSTELINGLATGGYLLVLLVTLVAVFNQLQLDMSSPLIQNFTLQIMAYLPNILGGCILILVAWLCATFLKQILGTGLKSIGLDKKIPSENPLSETVAEIIYWFTLLLFVPAILGVFQLNGLLAPTQAMVGKILGILPNLLACVLIIILGWFVAKILSEVVANLLAAGGADKLGEKIGFTGQMKISAVAGLVVYFFTLIPAIIAGLDAIQIYAISKPATDMLHTMFSAIPTIIAAIAIVIVTYLVAKPVSGFVSNILAAAGFNRLPDKLGLGGLKNASQLVGNVIVFFMLLFAIVEAARLLNFQRISEILAMLINFGGQVLLGSVIIIVGLWIANIAASSVNKASNDGETPLSGLVRTLVLILAIAMGLRAMGLANDIVNMAFGLTLGAVAVAFAVAFGLGGQDAAGKQIKIWMAKWNKE